MKITVWRGCKVVRQLELRDAPGPDISIDPWAGLVGTTTVDVHEAPVHYREGLRAGLRSVSR